MKNELRLLEGEFELRRLMLISIHIVLPALILTALAFGTLGENTNPIPGLDALSNHSFPIFSLASLLYSIYICRMIARCHYGIALHGSRINILHYSEKKVRDLNKSGVSTNILFLVLTSTLFFLTIFVVSASRYLPEYLRQDNWLQFIIWLLISGVTLSLIYYHFLIQDDRVRNEVSIDDCGKQPATDEQILEHRTISLKATIADTSIVTIMSSTLLVALMSALIKLKDLETQGPNDFLTLAIHYGAPVFSIYGLCVLAFSQIILIRLRVAYAEHSSVIDRIQGNNQNFWSISFNESILNLFLLLGIIGVFPFLVLCDYLDFFLEKFPFWAGFLIWVCYIFLSVLYYIQKLKAGQKIFLERNP